MAWAKFLAAVGRDRALVTEHAVLIVEDFQRAWVLRLGRSALVAAAHQDREPVVGSHTDLMRVDARVDRAGLRRLLAGREILVDAIDSHRTRVVERDQDVFGRDVSAEMDRTGRQAKRLAVLLQSAGRRVDREGGDVMLGADNAGTGHGVAACDIEIMARSVRPGILSAGRQGHTLAPG